MEVMRPVEITHRDMSWQEKGVTLRGAPTSWGPQTEDLSGKGKKLNEQGALTYRDRRGDTSRQEKNAILQGALMSWGTQRGTYQERERDQTNKGHVRVRKRMRLNDRHS